MTQITLKAKQLLDRLEPVDIKIMVENIFVQKPASYGPLSAEVLERIQLAVLKLIIDNGFHPEKIKNIGTLYLTDTRDLLMAAGFGLDLTAHIKWFDEQE